MVMIWKQLNAMTESEAYDAIVALLVEELGCSPGKLSMDTDLFGDLGVDGADAEELFEQIEKRYEVNFDGIDWDRHFGPEGSFNPISWIMPSYYRWHRNRVPVRVRHLMDAVRMKNWSMEYPAAS